mmetsp:Transcript_151751/g.486879  ORF Transcript_151751/g.486879 Transcript_151751/m.486879 type:complete len:149 (-) Transcript_151751:39-485(-)
MQKSKSEGALSFFKNSQVGSATGFIQVGSCVMALPHGKRNNMDAPRTFEATSEAQHQFREMPHCYASMSKKPLMPYSPNAHRSRLAMEDAPVPLKNASSIQFNDRFCVHKRRFVTTHQNTFTGAQPKMTSNPGILAGHTKHQRFLAEK